ncbi:hypothetical protein BHE74_00057153 [Ensete ventricosum]|nr:hypothetical protein BHE74_00057153 [Ensete ventricosum]
MVSKTGSSCDDWLMDCVCNVGSRKIVLRGLIVPEDACREARARLATTVVPMGKLPVGEGGHLWAGVLQGWSPMVRLLALVVACGQG